MILASKAKSLLQLILGQSTSSSEDEIGHELVVEENDNQIAAEATNISRNRDGSSGPENVDATDSDCLQGSVANGILIPDFQAEITPEEYFANNHGEQARGTFHEVEATRLHRDEADWSIVGLELETLTKLAGEGHSKEAQADSEANAILAFRRLHSPQAPEPIVERVDDPDGSLRYYRNGVLHRDDGPASTEVYPDYDGPERHLHWYRDGVLHQDDGPAVIGGRETNGDYEWWRNGRKHREEGPAVINTVQSFEWGLGPVYEWWMEGVLHKVQDGNGTLIYFKNGSESLREYPDGSSTVISGDGLTRDKNGEVIEEPDLEDYDSYLEWNQSLNEFYREPEATFSTYNPLPSNENERLQAVRGSDAIPGEEGNRRPVIWKPLPETRPLTQDDILSSAVRLRESALERRWLSPKLSRALSKLSNHKYKLEQSEANALEFFLYRCANLTELKQDADTLRRVSKR
ncbi:hypothetical protein [Aurantimonas coralicida]|uniref:hypothetical protein n=1 Tax=Aurantimonas coralicida TaxID=182270 RepID=UPI0023F10926|nr:hypothetical protein [Aurantimonas coralicida]